eukprot:jgi/Chrzof1/8663/Cz03g19080.t1
MAHCFTGIGVAKRSGTMSGRTQCWKQVFNGCLLCVVNAIVQLVAAEDSVMDGQQLYILKQAIATSNQLPSWQSGTDPCGGAATCLISKCLWEGLQCSHSRVTQVQMQGKQLSGPFPDNWSAPSQVQQLDLSNNSGLCGTLKIAVVSAKSTSGIYVYTQGTGLGNPCPAPAPALMPGAVAGIVIGGVVAVAVAATLITWLYLRRLATNATGEDLLLQPPSLAELARAQDSILLSKKRFTSEALHNFLDEKNQIPSIRATAIAFCDNPAAPSLAELARAQESILLSKKRFTSLEALPNLLDGLKQSPSIRAIAFSDTTDSVQNIRANNVKDSVIILRRNFSHTQSERARDTAKVQVPNQVRVAAVGNACTNGEYGVVYEVV